MEFPMQAFCLNGYNGGKISFTVREALDFPDNASYDGGYDIVGELETTAGSHHVMVDRYFSTTGALYRFGKEL